MSRAIDFGAGGRRLAVAVAAVGCAVAVGACGSSSSSTDLASSGGSAGIKFADCMRSHGVPSFPDPSTSGGGGQLSIKVGSGINPASPSFQAAQKACGKLLPGGGPGSGTPSAATKAQMLATSECMRAHGVSGFPDPTTTPPSSPAGYSGVIGHSGMFFAIPSTIDLRSPAVQQAAIACHLLGGSKGDRRLTPGG